MANSKLQTPNSKLPESFPAAALPLRLGHLYPDELNLYGDRGNILTFIRRCQWRGIPLTIVPIRPGEEFDPAGCDFLFVGGGADKEQKFIGDDLIAVKGEALRAAVEDDMPTLAVCGGYQLFARYYRPAEGDDIPGLGLFDAWTIHKGHHVPRCIGNVVVEWPGGTLVGFENHGGRTYLGPNARPLGRVAAGHGNNSEDGSEGAVYRQAYGTYLHGSLLPKNPAFTDHLLTLALRRAHGWTGALPPLDDRLELAAHAAAIKIARR